MYHCLSRWAGTALLWLHLLKQHKEEVSCVCWSQGSRKGEERVSKTRNVAHFVRAIIIITVVWATQQLSLLYQDDDAPFLDPQHVLDGLPPGLDGW